MSQSLVEKFGVEIEMVLGFHEDRLIEVLHHRGLTKKHIVKNLSDRNRAHIGIKSTPGYANPDSRPSHRGWALRKDPNDLNDWKQRGSYPSLDYRAGATAKYRTYWAEPLGIVRNIVQEYGLNIDVELSGNPQDPTYQDWKVSNDYSLVPLSDDQKVYEFRDRIAANEADNWDTTGIEVVTPPMRSNDPNSFDEIRKYLKVLNGDSESNYGVVTSKYAGLHVHIGFGKDGSRDSLLLVIQHLAYMLVQFEPLLVKFFPPHRDGGRQGSVICSNDTLSNLDAVISHERNVLGIDPSLQGLGRTIFLTNSIPAVRDLMHYGSRHKGYQVNFRNLADAVTQPWNQKSTIEFRLHESTTDAQQIEMWVRFCLAFCRTAELQAARSTDWNGHKITGSDIATTEFTKYKKQHLDDEVIIADLFNFLDLDDDLRGYWQARWDRYHDDPYMKLPTPELDLSFSASPSSENSDSNGEAQDRDSNKKRKRQASQSPTTAKARSRSRTKLHSRRDKARPAQAGRSLSRQDSYEDLG